MSSSGRVEGARQVILNAAGLTKIYWQGEETIKVLNGLDFTVSVGEQVAIVGRSGSGKSTLMHILAGLDTPDAGRILAEHIDLVKASNDERAGLRSRVMGFVYQNHHLLPEFNAIENIAMPLRIAGTPKDSAQLKARALLQEVGLAERATHFPRQLSGGERQRVAVARALAGDPAIILADEPTGNLDVENAQQVMDMMHRLSREHGCALVVVTHDVSALPRFDRVVRLQNGQLQDEPT